MQIREIKDSAVFDSFVENSSNNHYMKTSMWGEFEQKQAKRSYQMLGFYEKDRLVATALVLKGSWFGHPYLYIPKGPCMDYYDETARREVFTLLKQYADQQHVLFLRVDPNILRCARTIDGKLIAGGENHEDVTESLKRLGYTHKGYGYAYNGSWTNRFTLIVDLHEDMKTIRSRFSSRRKRCLKRCEEFHISTRTGSAEDIPTILDLQMQLVHQKSFQPSTYQYFKDILDCFGQNAVVYVTEIDLKAAEETALADLESKRKLDNPKALQNAQETYDLMHSCHQKAERMPVAAGLFIRTGQYNWCWYYYFHKQFNRFSPLDALHLYAMEDAKNHGVLHYDLCGFSGTVDPKDPEYHLYEYKHEFGAEFIEHIGEFDYVRNEGRMKRFRFEKLAFNHVKRKVWAVRYK